MSDDAFEVYRYDSPYSRSPRRIREELSDELRHPVDFLGMKGRFYWFSALDVLEVGFARGPSQLAWDASDALETVDMCNALQLSNQYFRPEWERLPHRSFYSFDSSAPVRSELSALERTRFHVPTGSYFLAVRDADLEVVHGMLWDVLMQ